MGGGSPITEARCVPSSGGCRACWPFFVVAVVLMASAPWVLLQPGQQTRTEVNRWFLTVAGSVDVIAAGVLLSLAMRPRRTVLIVVRPISESSQR